jgi:hypothetical protein
MVREIDNNDEKRFICEACGFTYKEREWAEKCEDYCTTHGACSIDITRHADQMKAI